MKGGNAPLDRTFGKIDPENLYDVCVVGGGPAGLTAGLYLARGRCRVLVVEQDSFGGQIAITEEVVNYPGVGKTSGKALTETMKRQAEAFGAAFQSAEVTDFDFSDDVKTLRTTSGEINCLGVVLATGAHPKKVGFEGEETFQGRGVAYCATCDGQFFAGREIFVVGGGYAAAEEAVFLTRFAKQVTILIRGEDFSCAKEVADKARSHEKITVLTHTVLEKVDGGGKVEYIRYQNTLSGQVQERRAAAGDFFGVFVFAGYAPNTSLWGKAVKLDEKGYILTDSGQKTNLPGVYAAGDVCVKPLRQVVTAVGDGATAATELEKYVASTRRKLGLSPALFAAPASPSSPSDPTPIPPLSHPNPTFSPVSHHPDPDFSPERGHSAPSIQKSGGESGAFAPEIAGQLRELFQKMEGNLILRVYPDDRAVSRELEEMMAALAALSPRIRVERVDSGAEDTPCVELCRGDGESTGLWFHGVPGGHEFTSFALALYNAAGPGQSLDADAARRVRAIAGAKTLRVFVTLSCTLCPEVVASAQRLAVENPALSVHVYDLKHFEVLRDRYGIFSVPCLVLNDQTTFGKKSQREILDLLEG